MILQDYIEREINKKEFRKDAVKTREFLFNTYEKPKLNRVRHIPEYIDDIRSMCVPGSYHLSVNEHWRTKPILFLLCFFSPFSKAFVVLIQTVVFCFQRGQFPLQSINQVIFICKLSSSEISYSFFGRSVFYFEQII